MKRILFCLSIIAALSMVYPFSSTAQRSSPAVNQPTRPSQPTIGSPDTSDLATQIAELRSAIARLEASMGTVQQQTPGTPGAGGGMQGIGGMRGRMMGRKPNAGNIRGAMMDDDMGEMPTASGGAMAGGMEGMDAAEMSMEMGMMGMGSMGQQGGAGMGGLRTSALPGFPGASHVYHIGATGFFLDHPEHISLDTAQQQELNRLKQGALLAKASTQRKINEAEQQLWELTAADQPDAETIEPKVEEIAKLRAQQRLDFIRAVGEAAKVLTDEQRKAILGTAKPQDHKAHSPSSK